MKLFLMKYKNTILIRPYSLLFLLQKVSLHYKVLYGVLELSTEAWDEMRKKNSYTQKCFKDKNLNNVLKYASF